MRGRPCPTRPLIPPQRKEISSSRFLHRRRLIYLNDSCTRDRRKCCCETALDPNFHLKHSRPKAKVVWLNGHDRLFKNDRKTAANWSLLGRLLNRRTRVPMT